MRVGGEALADGLGLCSTGLPRLASKNNLELKNNHRIIFACV